MNTLQTITRSLVKIIGLGSHAELTRAQRLGRRARTLLFLLAVNIAGLLLPANGSEGVRIGADAILFGGFFPFGFVLATPGEFFFLGGCVFYLIGFKMAAFVMALLTLPFAYSGGHMLGICPAMFGWVGSLVLLLAASLLMPKAASS